MRLISPIQPVSSTDEILLETAAGFIKLVPYSEGIVRARLSAHPEFSGKPSLMVQANAQRPTVIKVSEATEAIVVSTANLSIWIDRKTGAFTFLNSSGQFLMKEPDRGGKTLTSMAAVKSVFDETSESQSRQGADGVRIDVLPSKQVVDREAFHTKLEFDWAPGEALYGLGSHEEGMMNLRGQHQYLYQQNMKNAVPVLVSTFMPVRGAIRGCQVSGSFGSSWVTSLTIGLGQKDHRPAPCFMKDGRSAFTFDLVRRTLGRERPLALPESAVQGLY